MEERKLPETKLKPTVIGCLLYLSAFEQISLKWTLLQFCPRTGNIEKYIFCLLQWAESANVSGREECWEWIRPKAAQAAHQQLAFCRPALPGLQTGSGRHNISSQYLVTTSRQSSQPSLSAQLTFQAAVSKQSRQFQLTEPHRSCCQVYPDDGIVARPRLAVGLAGLLSPEPGRDDEWPGAPAGPAPRSRLII